MDIIADFMSATAHLRSPLLFRKWGAIGMVSACLTRRTYTSVMPGKFLWPNIYIMFVAPPACGKSEAIGAVQEIIDMHPDAERVLRGANSMTLEACINDMAKHFKKPEEEGEVYPLSYSLMNDELGSLFKEWKAWHIQTLASLWDIRRQADTWQYHLKTGGNSDLYNHYITMLVGAQPHWLAGNLPRDFFIGGMGSRFLFIYSDKKMSVENYDVNFDPTAYSRIAKQLSQITSVEGEVKLTAAARKAFQEWEIAGMPPVPTDPLLEHYNTRRNMHVGKLAMVIAMARHPDQKIISLDDLRMAWDMLFEAEEYMPTALMYAGSNPYRVTELQIVSFVRQQFRETNQPVSEEAIRMELGRHVPAHHANYVLTELVASGRLARVKGLRQYKPGAGL